MPRFAFQPAHYEDVELIGEDAFLFGKLEQAGIEIYVDHALSWEDLHISEQMLSNAGTMAK